MPVTEQIYLGDIPWDGAFVAAVIAALVAGASWYFQHLQLNKQMEESTRQFNLTMAESSAQSELMKKFQARQDGFLRYTTAVGYLESKSRHTQAEGVRILTAAREADWLTDEDRELIQGALDDAISRIVKESK